MSWKSSFAMPVRLELKGWNVCLAVLASFAAGSLLTAHRMHLNEVRAASNRVFEIDVYHTVPGKVPALESRFRDASKLLASHNLNVIGYWVPNDDPDWNDTFIYLVAHSSREEAEKTGTHFTPTRHFRNIEPLRTPKS